MLFCVLASSLASAQNNYTLNNIQKYIIQKEMSLPLMNESNKKDFVYFLDIPLDLHISQFDYIAKIEGVTKNKKVQDKAYSFSLLFNKVFKIENGRILETNKSLDEFSVDGFGKITSVNYDREFSVISVNPSQYKIGMNRIEKFNYKIDGISNLFYFNIDIGCYNLDRSIKIQNNSNVEFLYIKELIYVNSCEILEYSVSNLDKLDSMQKTPYIRNASLNQNKKIIGYVLGYL